MLKEQRNLMEEQILLRRERAGKEEFKIKKLGREPVFSDFEVRNPRTGGQYKVAIRGFAPGDNYCSCPDFRKNTLGTCKHVEAVLLRLGKTVAKGRIAGEFVPRITEVYLRYAEDLSIRVTLAADASGDLRKIASRFFTPQGALRGNMLARFHEFLKQTEPLEDRVVVYKDALEHVQKELDRKEGEREEAEYGRQLKKGAFGHGLLKAGLYEYQKEGVIFLACRRRCILGDDMGLGKTVQAIGAAQMLLNSGKIGKILIVCPASLKHQWKREIEKFSDNAAQVVEGNIVKRERLYGSNFSGFVITTYEAARRDAEAVNYWSPDLIILDEAQRIKNWETQTARRIKMLKSPYAFVLTGTPMENRIEELYSIVEYVDDRRLGPAFKFLADHTIYDPEFQTRVLGYKNLDVIREKLSPILLRRNKTEVLKQLPDRTDNNYFVPLTEQQFRPYDEQQEIVARIVARWRRTGFLSELDHRRMLCALANMRMICDSTFLFDKETNFSPKLDELGHILGELLEQGRKVVVFSQWTRMLDKIAEVILKDRIEYVYLHGGVPSAKRGGIIQKFWEDEEVKVFLSSDAGGLGLNLQAGSAVINVDIPWNPAVLEQRIGRVHRMGQERNVQVVNMITKSSIEERILDIIGGKKALFDGVFEGTCDVVDFSASSKSVFRELVDELVTEEPREPVAAAEELEAEELEIEKISAAAGGPSETPAPMVAGISQPLPDFNLFLRAGMDVVAALSTALSDSTARESASGAVKIISNPDTGGRNLQIELPPDPVLKSSLKTLGQFLVGLGS